MMLSGQEIFESCVVLVFNKPKARKTEIIMVTGDVMNRRLFSDKSISTENLDAKNAKSGAFLKATMANTSRKAKRNYKNFLASPLCW